MNRKGAHLDPDYFWSFVDASSGCWLWNGHKNTGGYGHISVNGKLVLAHRHAWTLMNGAIPDGKYCLHHCDTPACVNPDHLYLGTYKDNARDREQRGRGNHYTGEQHGAAKLTREQVDQILSRHSAGERQAALAREFNVNYRTVHAIVRGTTWRNS